MTAAERTQLEQALRAAGFVSWEEVELDDDGPYWDVDDARTENGQRYDLKLTFAGVSPGQGWRH